MKKIAVVPALLTLGNGVCGFAADCPAPARSALRPEQGTSYFAAAGLVDHGGHALRHARRLRRPAVEDGQQVRRRAGQPVRRDQLRRGAGVPLLLKLGPGWEPRPLLHQLLAGIAALYMVCAILRLARFNVDNTPDPSSHKRFAACRRLAAAGCIASLAIFARQLSRMARESRGRKSTPKRHAR